MRGDQEVFNEEPFIYQCNSNDPNNRCNVPPACTTTIKKGIQETGNCSPRYCRSSLYSFPSTSEMAKQCQVPMTISISAMAEPGPGEAPLLDSDFGSYGPLRCKRCKAYVCPQFRFIEGGRSFQCHLCQAITEVPQYYFQMTDHMGYRMDRLQRPELCRGSYEFIATKDYCKNDKLPDPPGFIFAIDVSYNSIRTGLVSFFTISYYIYTRNFKLLLGQYDLQYYSGSIRSSTAWRRRKMSGQSWLLDIWSHNIIFQFIKRALSTTNDGELQLL